MGELINGRTPEEIKQELQWLAYGCRESNTECDECIHAEICSNVTERDAPCNAIALIDRLESERDEALAKAPKWISVEEREPEFPCICYDGVNVISIPKNIASLTLKSGEKVFVSDAFLEAFPHALLEKLDDCTHILYWMPLPEPPEEGLE